MIGIDISWFSLKEFHLHVLRRNSHFFCSILGLLLLREAVIRIPMKSLLTLFYEKKFRWSNCSSRNFCGFALNVDIMRSFKIYIISVILWSISFFRFYRFHIIIYSFPLNSIQLFFFISSRLSWRFFSVLVLCLS